MNVQEYISSGILESYVLGDLSDGDRAEVEKNLALYPELRSELQRIENTHEQILIAQAVAPPDHVKRAILRTIKDRSGEREVPMLEYRSNTAFWRFAVAASITIAIIASWMAHNYYNKWNDTSKELTALIAQNQRIAEEHSQVNRKLNKLADDVQVMNNPAFRRVIMNGTQAAPGALASVYWNESTRELYLQIQHMRGLSDENQYQLWAIIDGKPVDAGVFDTNPIGLIRMKDIGKGATNFAVTIEPRGGKNTPTMETMQVIGTVAKA